MPGAWEILERNRVLTAILHVETTTIAWAMGLRNLQLPGPVAGFAGMPFDHARNQAAMAALDMQAEYLFFLDSDVIPPPDTVLRLMAHNAPIVSGVYCRRSHPHGVPVAIKDGKWLNQLPQNALMEVDLVGAGCLLIRTDVLQKLPPSRNGKHWFDWRVDLKGAGIVPDHECMSEDFVFCMNCKKAGFPVLLDTSIQCRHVGYAEATFGSLLPLQHAA